MSNNNNTSSAAAAAPAPASEALAAVPSVPLHTIDTDDSDISVVDDFTDSLFDDSAASAHGGSTAGDAEEAQVARTALNLTEAFDLLSIAAAAVSEALSNAAAEASAAAAAAAAAAALAAANAVPVLAFARTGAPYIAGALYSVVPAAPLIAVPDNGERWYSVTKGKYVGLTRSSTIASGATQGVSNSLQNAYGTQAAALADFNLALQANLVVVI